MISLRLCVCLGEHSLASFADAVRQLRCGEAVALGGFPDLSKLLNPLRGLTALREIVV